jgi:hypothetical protein
MNETGKVLWAQQRAMGTNMHPKQWLVKFTTVLLPFCAGLKISLPASNRQQHWTEISAPQGKMSR